MNKFKVKSDNFDFVLAQKMGRIIKWPRAILMALFSKISNLDEILINPLEQKSIGVIC